ncbi:hypothetical protein PR048_016003 [Dryococelus australis]|uniref:Reverse transcriptase domain-containing protein n=1 Tax=Dryococelus australis TaxID=614101 RepID=A0ABQ9HII6_9NEOP|nr:hypothetical protein PR048_016003 [Dryococelus australis]
MSKIAADRKFTRTIIGKYKLLRINTPKTSYFARPFEVDKIISALSKTKLGKAAGFDGVYHEFLVHTGPRTKSWLPELFTDMMQLNRLANLFKSTKIVALLKPGKPDDLPESYRPIALLSVMLKLFERVIYNRLSPVIDKIIPLKQAGLRNGRCCMDQVLTITNFIEEGFQRKLNTGVVFADLTTTYDTEWKKGLLYNLKDNIAYAIQMSSFEQLNRALTNDMKVFVGFCKHWRLKPSVTKLKVACFHLNNRLANAKLEVGFEG